MSSAFYFCRPDEMSGAIVSRISDQEFEAHGFEHRSSKTNDLTIYSFLYLSWYSALLGQGEEQWNEEDQLSMIEISTDIQLIYHPTKCRLLSICGSRRHLVVTII